MATLSRSGPLRVALLILAACVGALVAACNGCHRDGKGNGGTATSEAGPPTVRVYVLSDLAGALEPCGCQKDMLGGVDHFAALVSKERDKAPNSIVVSAGPTFFEDPFPRADHAQQDQWKAEALAAGLKVVGFRGFAPGANDWQMGAPELVTLGGLSNGALCAANVSGPGAANAVDHVVIDVGGTKLGIVGAAAPKSAKGAPDGVTVADATKALSEAAKKARAEGAKIVVGIAAIDRGEAVRAAEAVPELDVLAIGSQASEGDANDDPKPPRFVGNVLVVEPSNHLTRVSIVDFFLRPGSGEGGKFSDGSGLAKAQEVTDLTTQIDDLKKRIMAWEKDPAQNKADVDAQKKRLQDMQDRLAKAQQPPPAPSGNFLRYSLVDVREALGSDATAKEAMKSYYVRVDEFNKNKFAGKKAPAPAKGEPEYVGAEACKTCHPAAYDVWTKTGHHQAYETIAKDSKEFNLDCVSCHVTGYEKPGGSTVTDVDLLKEVQCEACHGAGSAHLVDPTANALDLPKEETVCTGCHHPPHTDVFDFKVRKEKILGPGHGKKGAPADVPPPKGWKPPKLRFPEG